MLLLVKSVPLKAEKNMGWPANGMGEMGPIAMNGNCLDYALASDTKDEKLRRPRRNSNPLIDYFPLALPFYAMGWIWTLMLIALDPAQQLAAIVASDAGNALTENPFRPLMEFIIVGVPVLSDIASLIHSPIWVFGRR